MESTDNKSLVERRKKEIEEEARKNNASQPNKTVNQETKEDEKNKNKEKEKEQSNTNGQDGQEAAEEEKAKNSTNNLLKGIAGVVVAIAAISILPTFGGALIFAGAASYAGYKAWENRDAIKEKTASFAKSVKNFFTGKSKDEEKVETKAKERSKDIEKEFSKEEAKEYKNEIDNSKTAEKEAQANADKNKKLDNKDPDVFVDAKEYSETEPENKDKDKDKDKDKGKERNQRKEKVSPEPDAGEKGKYISVRDSKYIDHITNKDVDLTKDVSKTFMKVLQVKAQNKSTKLSPVKAKAIYFEFITRKTNDSDFGKVWNEVLNDSNISRSMKREIKTTMADTINYLAGKNEGKDKYMDMKTRFDKNRALVKQSVNMGRKEKDATKGITPEIATSK